MCKKTGKVAFWLVVVGAVNWGLVGLGYFFGGNWNLVNMIFGQWPVFENIVYLAVGASAILSITSCKKHCMMEHEDGMKM